jgi:hypothetical protein
LTRLCFVFVALLTVSKQLINLLPKRKKNQFCFWSSFELIQLLLFNGTFALDFGRVLFIVNACGSRNCLIPLGDKFETGGCLCEKFGPCSASAERFTDTVSPWPPRSPDLPHVIFSYRASSKTEFIALPCLNSTKTYDNAKQSQCSP